MRKLRMFKFNFGLMRCYKNNRALSAVKAFFMLAGYKVYLSPKRGIKLNV
jgi:hypothetical protein